MAEIKQESESFQNKLTPRSNSVNREMNSEIQGFIKVSLQNSNTLFGFQTEENHNNIEELKFDEPSKEFSVFAPSTNYLDYSNTFSTFNDKSQPFIINETTIEKPSEIVDKSYFTIDAEFEKQVELLCEDDDDLNNAKLSENNDYSILSSKSNTNFFSNTIQHNLTTPFNNIKRQTTIPLTENDDKSSTINPSFNNNTNNNNILSQQPSLSSIFEKNPVNDNLFLNNNNNINSNNNLMGIINNNNNYLFPSNDNSNNYNSNRKKDSFDLQIDSFDSNNNLNNNMLNNKNIWQNSYFIGGYGVDNNQFCNINYYSRNIPTMTYSFCKYNTVESNQNTSSRNINLNHYSKNSSNSSLRIHNNNLKKGNLCNKSNANFNINNVNNITSINKNMNKTVKLIKDPNGSKLIQKKIEEKNAEFLNQLFEKIKNNLCEIINDQFGNYVIQRYVQFCDKKIISKMLSIIKNRLFDISINSYGTRALQKMIENLSNNYLPGDIDILVNFISGNLVKLIRDINGNHVVQCVLININNKDNLSPIYKEISENILQVSKIKQGCCVFSKILDNINDADKIMITESVLANIDTLVNDEYGNFIIQRIINLNIEIYNDRIFNYIKDKIIKLTCQKFSSNVIEASIGDGISIQGKVLDKLIEKNNVVSLITDPYANYIIQKCLNILKSDKDKTKFNSVIDQIKKSFKALSQTGHGRKIADNLMKKYKEYFNNQGSTNCNNCNGSKYKGRNNKNK